MTMRWRAACERRCPAGHSLQWLLVGTQVALLTSPLDPLCG